MKYLIITADDFGLSQSVNAGILEVFTCGHITSASLMVNMPGFTDAVRIVKQHPRLGVGLHFNLTYGLPLSPPSLVPSLVDEQGRFTPKGRWNPDDVQRELAAQWGMFQSAGLTPTHIDSHNMIQTYPNVFPALCTLAKLKDIPMRHTVKQPLMSIQHPLTTHHLVATTYDTPAALVRFTRALSQMPDGFTEVLCHPGYVDATVEEYSTWTTLRERELLFWKTTPVRELARKYGIKLCTYRAVKRKSGR